jgi:hypothetical protein
VTFDGPSAGNSAGAAGGPSRAAVHRLLYSLYVVKKSAAVRLTFVAAVGIAAHAQARPDPCAAASFNEAACRAAVQANGYCWNGRWVKLSYHYPYPYYYDAYLDYMSLGGAVQSASIGSCGVPRIKTGTAHGFSRAGFGACGAGHSAHG